MRLTAICLLLALLPARLAAAPPPLFGISFSGADGNTLSVPMQIALLLTALTLLPAVIMSVTPFLRITIVLHFLRQALGTQSAPSNQVLSGLALFLTALIVAPLASEIHRTAWLPLEQGALTQQEALAAAGKPLKAFLSRYTREKDVQLFLEAAHASPPRTPEDIEMRILIPAYILSELKTSFQIGAVLFLPFLIIDIVVASVTLSIGMVQLPPVMLSAPFKILLFVLVDGWNLLVGSLLKSFSL